LGKTKRAAEEMTAWFAAEGAGTYLSVRFGNVLGSRGSMLHAFTALIERGGRSRDAPGHHPVLHDDPEACELVIQARCDRGPGDVLVLDMAPRSDPGCGEAVDRALWPE
jgi:dTDP-glucose 4,6-dehydratase